MAKKTKIKVIDRGWKRIHEELKNIPYEVAVGIQGAGASIDRDGITNVQLGSIHEFGSENGVIPQRSFIRSTVSENNDAYKKQLQEIIKNVTEKNKKAVGELMFFGDKVKLDIVQMIKDIIPPPLTDETVARKKGETTPLIDTGFLWNSISSVVRKK